MAEKKKKTENKVLDFLKKNWANTISISISIIAILISIQSNAYSRKSSNSEILVEDIGEVYNNGNYETWYLTVYGCNDDYSDGYLLYLETVGEFWLSNIGGLDTTLLATYFTSEFEIYDPRFDKNARDTWSTSIYEHPNLAIIGEEITSLEMPAGKGMPINLHAVNTAYFPTSEKALSYFQSLIGSSNQRTIENNGTWVFRFSDGKTYSKTYNYVEIRLLDYIENKPKTLNEQLEISCKEMYRSP